MKVFCTMTSFSNEVIHIPCITFLLFYFLAQRLSVRLSVNMSDIIVFVLYLIPYFPIDMQKIN